MLLRQLLQNLYQRSFRLVSDGIERRVSLGHNIVSLVVVEQPLGLRVDSRVQDDLVDLRGRLRRQSDGLQIVNLEVGDANGLGIALLPQLLELGPSSGGVSIGEARRVLSGCEKSVAAVLLTNVTHNEVEVELLHAELFGGALVSATRASNRLDQSLTMSRDS